MPRLTDDRLGGEPLRYLVQPKGILMRISDVVKRCVAFVGVKTDSSTRWGGTAFFISLNERCTIRENVRLPVRFNYVVTAKHVADHLEGGDGVIRFNTRQGRHGEFETAGMKWWTHPTENVDSAVSPFDYREDLDIATISDSLFATPDLLEEYEIGIGDEVYIAGLFTSLTDTEKNQPVLRTGHLAMMPDEKIPFAELGLIDAYLIETKSFGGLSGCPVFVRHTVSTPLAEEPNGPPIGQHKRLYGGGSSYLLGSLIGHWRVPDKSDPDLKDALNLGFAAVVPMYKILEVLHHPELVEMRKAKLEAEKKRVLSSAVLDSALEFGETQTTPQGLKIPVPTKDQFIGALEKSSRKKTE